VPGNGSLNFVADSNGEGEPDVGVRTGGAMGAPPNATWWSGDAGLLRRDREPVLLYKLEMGEGWMVPACGVSSSSASSDMSHTLGAPECVYESS
jgi:hypothetical protein